VRAALVSRRRRARLAALLSALALGVAGLGACGDDDSDSDAGSGSAGDTPSGPESQGGSGGLPEGAEGFVACLRDHGIDITVDDLTGGGTPPIDPQDPKVLEAVSACQSELPAGAGGGP
jgi:hypothetical protein